MIRAVFLAAAALLALPVAAHADCYTWPLRDPAVYDGDTVNILMPGLPAELARMSVRFDGIDAPERGRRAQCEAEAELAEQARDFVVWTIENAERVEFCEPQWGKYAGRVVARVVVDGEDLAEELIIAGLAHAYDGGQREGWCEPTAGRAAPVPTWQRNAVQVAALDGRPMIAVVIDDMGVDRGRSTRMLRLPGPLTMAYMTYARDLPRQARAARRMGHELLLHVPMEPEDGGEDAGPNALVVAEGAAEIGRRLDWGLRRLSGYVGISNHMGSRFTADDRAMAVVMETLQRRGLLFLDSLTTTATVAIAQARRYGVPAVSRHVFLDNERTPEAVRRALAETEAEARRRGYAVAVGHPHDVTREALADWLPRLARRGFVLVPLSAVVGRAPEMG